MNNTHFEKIVSGLQAKESTWVFQEVNTLSLHCVLWLP